MYPLNTHTPEHTVNPWTRNCPPPPLRMTISFNHREPPGSPLVMYKEQLVKWLHDKVDKSEVSIKTETEIVWVHFITVLELSIEGNITVSIGKVWNTIHQPWIIVHTGTCTCTVVLYMYNICQLKLLSILILWVSVVVAVCSCWQCLC